MKHVSELELRGVRICPTCNDERVAGQMCPTCMGTGEVQVKVTIGELASHLSIWYAEETDASSE